MSKEYIKFVPFVCDNFEADLRHLFSLSPSFSHPSFPVCPRHSSFLPAIFGSSFGVISIYFAELTICQVLGLGTKSIDERNTWQIKRGKWA